MSRGVIETRLTRDHVERYTSAGHWGDLLLRDHVDRHRKRSPNQVAVVDTTRSLTYAELLETADRVAANLLALGLRRDDVVSAQLPNWSEFVVLLLAVERFGAILNPITTILREREVRQILRLAASRCLVVARTFRGFEHLEMALSLREVLPALEHVIVARAPGTDGALSWDAVERDPSKGKEIVRALDLLRPRSNDVTELAFTSGTTGMPKGVMHTHNTALYTVGSTLRRQKLGPSDVIHVALPVGHNAGYFYGVRLALQSGATLVMQESWDPGEAIRLIAHHGVTFTMGATTHLVDLLECAKRGDAAVSSLRVYMCGGASIPPTIAERAVRELRGRFCPVFGMTEHGHSTGTDDSTPIEKIVTTDGSFQPEMAARVVDDRGAVLAAGREGRLQLRGPFNFVGYVQGRAFTEPFFDQDDFFDTGDLGVIDAQGYLRITGRAKDLILRGGENIPVKEIEDLLSTHPAVREVAIVGVPDSRLGERAVACVRLRDGMTLDLAALRGHLDDLRVTRQFWPEALVTCEELPRTPSGKVQKFVLRELPAVRGALTRG